MAENASDVFPSHAPSHNQAVLHCDGDLAFDKFRLAHVCRPQHIVRFRHWSIDGILLWHEAVRNLGGYGVEDV